MSEQPYDWQADVKAGGEAISIVYSDGEWAATGGEMADMILACLEANLNANIDTETANPAITGRMPVLFEKSLREIPGLLVYGIDDRTDDDETADAVI